MAKQITVYRVDKDGAPVLVEDRPKSWKLIRPQFLWGYNVIHKDNQNMLCETRQAAIKAFIEMRQAEINEIETRLLWLRRELEQAERNLREAA